MGIEKEFSQFLNHANRIFFTRIIIKFESILCGMRKMVFMTDGIKIITERSYMESKKYRYSIMGFVGKQKVSFSFLGWINILFKNDMRICTFYGNKSSVRSFDTVRFKYCTQKMDILWSPDVLIHQIKLQVISSFLNNYRIHFLNYIY